MLVSHCSYVVHCSHVITFFFTVNLKFLVTSCHSQYITLFFALWVVWAKQLGMFNGCINIVVIYSVVVRS